MVVWKFGQCNAQIEPSSPCASTRRAGSIAEQVFRTLRSSIVTMRLTPATALSEQDIADRLKVSRQPVREAFIKLSEIGLVRVLPQRGTFVVKISAKAVTDARFVREAVECAIARRASEGIGKAAMDELRAILAEQRKARARPGEHSSCSTRRSIAASPTRPNAPMRGR